MDFCTCSSVQFNWLHILVKGHEVQINMSLRNDFGKLDPTVLISPLDVASVIGAPTVGAVYTALARGELPELLIRGNRRIRWTVGQIRAHIRSLEVAFKARQTAKKEAGESSPVRTGPTANVNQYRELAR